MGPPKAVFHAQEVGDLPILDYFPFECTWVVFLCPKGCLVSFWTFSVNFRVPVPILKL